MVRKYIRKEDEQTILDNIEKVIANYEQSKRIRNKYLKERKEFNTFNNACQTVAVYESVLSMIGFDIDKWEEKL